ncbi:MAG: UTP--glucose-1-phosphate uridylyltransferase, partial [Jatrophihabitans sp.]
PFLDLDQDPFKLVGAFDSRVPEGPPSLVDAERFVVRGDARFGRGVKVVGSVELVDAGEVPSGAVLS